jgi:hypothetical protein
LESNCIPSWNDESYLNYWATQNRFKHFDPSFCYDESYKNLDYLWLNKFNTYIILLILFTIIIWYIFNMGKILVFIPTFNEAKNIKLIRFLGYFFENFNLAIKLS